jgi:hypothetical protein
MASESKKLIIKPENDSPSSNLSEENNNFRPSVPIYLYRQLVKELEDTKVNLEILKSQNQALVAQNKDLQEEVANIFHSVQNLQTILNHKDSPLELDQKSKLRSAEKRITIKTEQGFSTILLSKDLPATESSPLKSDSPKHILEVDSHKSLSGENSAQNREINSLWLMIMVIFIFLTCFLGSILLVSSLLNNQNNSNSN